MHIKDVRPCTGPASANGFLNIGRFNLEITPDVTLYDMTLVRAPHGKLLLYGPQTAYGAPAWSMAIPMVRMENSQKCAKGVHLQDLADYLDERRAAAVKECLQLTG